MSHIVNTEVTMSSLELLEIINKARVEFGESEIRPYDFHNRIKDELEDDEAFNETFVKVPTAGRPADCYTLTHDQAILVGMRESKGVRRKVLQKLKNNEQAQQKPPVSQPALADQLLLVETAARMLNVSESGKLHMLSIAAQRHGIEPKGLLPSYAVDAAPDMMQTGSSMVTKSLSDLLTEFKIEFSARHINPLLEKAGIIRREYRKASKGPDKGFWSITEAGLHYGKNVTSASNPKETQPHWYASRFNDLMDLIQACRDTRH